MRIKKRYTAVPLQLAASSTTSLTTCLTAAQTFTTRLATAFVLLFLVFQSSAVLAQAGAPAKPSNVSAFIYSSTAAELFWTPAPDTVVEITRSGEDLGQHQSRSLFQADLVDGENYNYSIRSVASDGARSEPVVLILSTANFQLPIKTVSAVGEGAPSAQVVSPPPPSSDSAAQPQPQPQPQIAAIENTVPEVTSITQGSDNCIASDISGLNDCVNNAGAFSRIDIAQDIRCDGNCCPNGQALINLNNVDNLELHGHGHRILRAQNQRQCSLLDIANSSNIRVQSIFLDDDISVVGCQVSDRCPRMVHVRSSNNVSFDQTHVSHGKGYAFYVNATDGFTFKNGSLHNSGVLGMYVGHSGTPSRNIQITGSTFSDNQTNGVALLGVVGNSVTDNVVADNVFVRNHRRGQFAVLPRFGTGFTGGGQLYVAQVSNVTIRNNLIKDGYCDNCFVQRVARTGISGIEVGIPNEASVRNTVISGNRVVNADGFGIAQNSNSALSNVSVLDNQVLNTTLGLHIEGVNASGNRVIDTQRFNSFESGNDFSSAYNGSVQCSSGGSVQRQCGLGARFGQCAAELTLGSADCSDVQAQLLGRPISVRAGQSVVVDGWVSNPVGNWCVRFNDSSGNQIGEQCQNIANSGSSDVQTFIGLPGIDAVAPGGTSSAQLRIFHQQAGASMFIDDVKFSVQ